MPYVPYLVPVSVKGIVIDDKKVWLRHNERNEWELPGGKIDEVEQPEETVIREMQEELGYEVTVNRLIHAHMYKIKVSSDESRGVLVLSYLCNIVRKVGEFELIGEAGEAKFQQFSFDEIKELNMPEFYKKAIALALQDNQY